MSTKPNEEMLPQAAVVNALLKERPYIRRLSSGARRALLAQRGIRLEPPLKPGDRFVPAQLAVSALLPTGIRAPGNLRVNDPNEDVNAGNRTTQSEPSLAVSGANIVVGFNDSNPSSSFSGYSASNNGGASFTDEGGIAGQQSGDPVLVADRAGNFYFAMLSVDANNHSDIGVSRSTDGGVTFGAPVNASTTVNSQTDFQDKEWLAVDTTGGPSNGNLYLTWTRFTAGGEQIMFTRSTDGGTTWSAPLSLSPLGNVQFSMPAVAPDGSVYVSWFNGATSQIRIARSTDAGLNFVNPVAGNGAVQAINPIPDPMNGNIRADSIPSLTIDPNSGTLYIVYPAQSGADHADVFLVHSLDQGQNWSNPVRVNDDGTTTDQWMPSVAVNSVGVVAVMFYDRRNDPANNLNIDVYLATSSDNGVSFQPNVRVTTTSFPPSVNFDPVIARNYMGDYNQIVTAGKSFYMAWGDNRDMVGTRNDPDVYFAIFDPGGVPITGVGVFELLLLDKPPDITASIALLLG